MSIRICDECGNVYDEAAAIISMRGERIYDLPVCEIPPFVARCPHCGNPEFATVPDRIAERRPTPRREGMAAASR